MLKLFRNSAAAVRFCRFQRSSQSFHKLSGNCVHPQGYLKCSFPYLNYRNVASSLSVPSRPYCTVDLDDGNDSDGLEEAYVEDSVNGCMKIKNFLYGDLANDDLLNQINSCESEEDLLTTLCNNIEGISRHHTVLFLVKLWYCKNPKFKFKIVKSQNEIEMLQAKILQHAGDMNLDELSVCFLFLTKLSVDMQTDVMSTILESIMNHLKNDQSTDISLGALSRFAVTVNLNPQLNESLFGQNIMPHALYHLDRVTTSEELRLISICLMNLQKLLSNDTIKLVEQIVYRFIEEGKLKDDTSALLKVLQFMSFMHWTEGNFRLIRLLLLELQDKIPTFNARELQYVGMLCQSNFEPASVIAAAARRASELLKNDPSPEILPSTVFYSTPQNRQYLTNLAKNFLFIEPNPDSNALKAIFKTLRYLKMSDMRVCHAYWSRVINSIMANPSHRVLVMHCHRYMHFNNNLNGTYKNVQFEKTVIDLLVKDLRDGITALLPSGFSKSASFILAYGHTPDDHTFPEYIVQRIEAMQEQFTVSDCLQLTRGLQIAMEMRFYRERRPELLQQIVRLENVFNACTERHLDQPNLTLSKLNRIIRSYNNRKSERKASIYQKMIDKYETIPHEPLSSRIIRDITFNLNTAKYNVPTICDSINEYIVENRESVLGDTVEKVLYCFYNLNYYPKDERIFKCAVDTINRDFDIMSGLAVIEGCLALAFFKELPGALVDRVFNISFIQRVEDELEQCYSKDFYPQRVLNSVMQLNRAVCLDYPENKVPWFQQNYIEAQLSNLPTTKNKFHGDVKQVLLNFVTDEKFLKIDHITPYGYRIDFVLYIDANKKLMIPPNLNDTALHVNKIAILLLDTDTLCQNDFQKMRGKQVLKERHLEMMGFKVVQINYIQWNSMYMGLPGAKNDYIKEMLSY